MDYHHNQKKTRRPLYLTAAIIFVAIFLFWTLFLKESVPSYTSKAVAVLAGNIGSPDVKGTVIFSQSSEKGPVTIIGTIINLPSSGDKGFHIHEFGNLTQGCNSAGPHFNPHNETHGGPDSPKRHVGDLGNVNSDSSGRAEIDLTDSVISLNGLHSIIGRAVVIHALTDDLGTDGGESLENGNAGPRLACGVIGLA